MSEFAEILLGAAIFDNILLFHFIGSCGLPSATTHFDRALRLASLSAAAVLCSSTLARAVEILLLRPFDLEFLRLPVLLLLVALTTGALDIIAGAKAALGRASVAAEMPLLAGNSLLLGIVLQNATADRGIAFTLAFTLGATAGFVLVLLALAAMQERIVPKQLPRAFQGVPITLFSLGLMALGLHGLAGVR